MTDCSKVPTLDDIETSKSAMSDIEKFTYFTTDTFVDSNGITRDTVAGRMKTMGYSTPVPYVAGIIFTTVDNTKTVDEGGIIYAPLLSSLPLTTSGIWGTAGVSGDNLKFFVVQGVTIESLATNLSNVYVFSTLTDMLLNTINFPVNKIIRTNGALTSIDGSGASWLANGSAAAAGSINYNTGTVYDANGNGYVYVQMMGLAKKEVDPTHFGVSTDGLGNHGAAFNDLLTFGDVLRIPSSELGIAISGVTVGELKSIIGSGAKSGLKAADGINAPMITILSNSTVKGFRLFALGGKNSGLTLQDGIVVENRYRTMVSEIWADGLGGSFYRTKDAVNVHQGNTLSTYIVDNCNIGVNADSRGEYLNATGGSVTECNVGFRVQGGNINATGTVCSDNLIGVDLIQGSNDAHGQITGMLLNHNVTRTIRAVDLANGFTFVGCQMFEGGDIELTNVSNVHFRGGVKSNVNVLEDGCTNCSFTQFELDSETGNTPNVNNPSEVFYLDCNLKGLDMTAFDTFNGGLLQTSQATDQTAIGVISDFTFDTIDYNAIPGNLAYTIQNFYNAGIITGATSKVRPDSTLKMNAIISIGRDDDAVFDPKLVSVSIQGTVSGKKLGFFQIVDHVSIGGTNFVRYAFNGTLPRQDCKITIDNATGVGVTIYADGAATLVQTTMEVTGW
mgnify:CR=1 FL=1